MVIDRRVVVAGWGQVVQPKESKTDIKDPLGLMVQASVRAAELTTSRRTLIDLDGIMVVRTVSRHYTDPEKQLADQIGASPRFSMVSDIGGNSPQTLINQAAGMIARNELDSMLIAGAEAYVQREGGTHRVDSALFRGIPDDYAGDDLTGATLLEKMHGIEHPMQGFPLFETALWAASGLEIDMYLKKISSMWAGFSSVAANNPYAWSKTAKSAEQIMTSGPNNRPVAFPYTKYLNSFVTVDQGAAIILMSEEKAAAVANTKRQTVFFLGGGYAQDPQRFMVQKSDFTTSPPLQKAVQKALDRAQLPFEKLSCFDLYSCFPSAVTIAKKMIGISDDDPRPLTLTGGLGFFGGPGNNYSLHSTATLADLISRGERENGLITALGWFMHKHAAGVYGNRPHGGSIGNNDVDDQKNPYWGNQPEPIKEQVNGLGVIETYTIIFSLERTPSYAVLYGKTVDGFRFVAGTKDDPAMFRALMSGIMVGHQVEIRFDTAQNKNIAHLV